MRPLTRILWGFGLSVMGVALPLLMLIHLLPSTIFLNFFSFTASMGGLMLGIGGAAQYVRAHRK
jgi:hypothetical protein